MELCLDMCCTLAQSNMVALGMHMSAPFLLCTVIDGVDGGGQLRMQHPVPHIQPSVQEIIPRKLAARQLAAEMKLSPSGRRKVRTTAVKPGWNK